jgi:nanoRNase/pAp phosphatase (c-di-AMP/oligoRNAs hydrolase)
VASAVALRYLLAETSNIQAHIAYQGIIGRAENKALVKYLGSPLHPMSTLASSPQSPVALVDTQPGAGNNALPPDALVALVIDHHPWREATASARFTDVRTEVGSTSTVLTEYLQAAGLEPEQQLATALFYGIKTDTMGLSREASPADVAAYFYLQPRIDVDALIEIERAQVPADYFKSFDTTLRTTQVYEGRVLVSYVGSLAYPDLAAEMADLLLRLEGSQWVICIGVYETNLILAIRTRNRQGGAGLLAQAIVGKQGTAGGHGSMAGGLISLQGRDPEQLADHIRQRALKNLDITPETQNKPLI